KQHQNEVNEIRTERQARNANPLALVAATQQLVYNPSQNLLTTIKHQQTNHNLLPKAKEKRLLKLLLHMIQIMELNKNVDNTPRSYRRIRYDRQTGQYENQKAINVTGTSKECKKAKRLRDSSYHKEKMLMCKQQEVGIQISIQEVLTATNVNNGPIFDKEPLEKVHSNNDYNVFATERQHTEQPETINDTYVVEKDDNNITPDSLDMCNDEGKLRNKKDKLEKYCSEAAFQVFDIKQKFLELEKQLLAHKNTISTLQYEKDEHKKFYKTSEDKEMERVIYLENEVKYLNDIVYKTGQSIQTMNMLNRNCKTSFAKPQYLKKPQSAKPCLYDIGCCNDNLANMLTPESDETIRLAKESRSKLTVDNTSLDVVEFKQTLQEEMVQDLRYFNSLEKEVESI
ncbi:hypothetical protein Tco_1267110, partial [Tanacetum coccineum]